eukprot:TRINITY_DN484_c0_g1_i1.p1 TRINITY_DN484_c0_g1~~TRINITY_DN484_c0_g1_i1.p1  ORF type:complete len:894 (+),score=166.66 TRINITY_DN484_c0_g1_i1:74-2683(+)
MSAAAADGAPEGAAGAARIDPVQRVTDFMKGRGLTDGFPDPAVEGPCPDTGRRYRLGGQLYDFCFPVMLRDGGAVPFAFNLQDATRLQLMADDFIDRHHINDCGDDGRRYGTLGDAAIRTNITGVAMGILDDIDKIRKLRELAAERERRRAEGIEDDAPAFDPFKETLWRDTGRLNRQGQLVVASVDAPTRRTEADAAAEAEAARLREVAARQLKDKQREQEARRKLEKQRIEADRKEREEEARLRSEQLKMQNRLREKDGQPLAAVPAARPRHEEQQRWVGPPRHLAGAASPSAQPAAGAASPGPSGWSPAGERFAGAGRTVSGARVEAAAPVPPSHADRIAELLRQMDADRADRDRNPQLYGLGRHADPGHRLGGAAPASAPMEPSLQELMERILAASAEGGYGGSADSPTRPAEGPAQTPGPSPGAARDPFAGGGQGLTGATRTPDPPGMGDAGSPGASQRYGDLALGRAGSPGSALRDAALGAGSPGSAQRYGSVGAGSPAESAQRYGAIGTGSPGSAQRYGAVGAGSPGSAQRYGAVGTGSPGASLRYGDLALGGAGSPGSAQRSGDVVLGGVGSAGSTLPYAARSLSGSAGDRARLTDPLGLCNSSPAGGTALPTGAASPPRAAGGTMQSPGAAAPPSAAVGVHGLGSSASGVRGLGSYSAAASTGGGSMPRRDYGPTDYVPLDRDFVTAGSGYSVTTPGRQAAGGHSTAGAYTPSGRTLGSGTYATPRSALEVTGGGHVLGGGNRLGSSPAASGASAASGTPPKASAPASAGANSSPSPGSGSGATRICFRLPDGRELRTSFDLTATVGDLCEHVNSEYHRPRGSPVGLQICFPPRTKYADLCAPLSSLPELRNVALAVAFT